VSVLSRLIPWALAALLAAGLLAWVLSPDGPGRHVRDAIDLGELSEQEYEAQRQRERRQPSAPAAPAAPLGAERGQSGARAPDVVRGAGATAWTWVHRAGTVLLLAVGALAALRLLARVRRRSRRLWLVPGRTDEASPDKLRRLLETWQQQLVRRWWRRLLLGQPALCLELHAWPDPHGSEARLALVAPDNAPLTAALAGALRAVYPDARLEPAHEQPGWTQAIVRLKKRHALDRALRVPETYDDSLVDALASAMAATGEPATVQLALTPTPALADRLARSLFRALERGHERERMREAGDPGLRSEVVERELAAAAAAVQHRPLFFCDLRVAAHRLETARLLAGVLQGESGAENRLVPRETRVRRALYARRLLRGLGNPLPPWRRGVFSSAELAGLWHGPSFSLDGVRVRRSAVPRIPAPPGVLRPPREEAILADELGPVAVRPADKPLAAMLLGLPGTGKSSLLAASVLADLRDENCAVVVLDAKNEFARAALSVIPENFPRRVHFLDFWRPEVGYNPFAADADRDALADAIVESVKGIHLEGSIQASSERYLKLAALAVMGWAARAQPPGGATFQDMAEILSPRGIELRKKVIAAIEPDPELHEAHRFFAEELPADLAGSLAQMTIRLDAPKNKLAGLTNTPSLDSILRHPVALDLDEIIRRREVLIVAGSVGDFGEGTAEMLMQLILHGVHRAVSRQRNLPARQRARVAVKVDEAHYLFSPGYARMLAMDRSAGLELMSAWQSMAQVPEPALRQQLLDLHRHKFAFAVGTEDADLMAQVMQPARSNQIRDDEQARKRMRVASDAMTHMPNHHAAVSLVDRGERLASFIGQTFPLRESEARVEHHLDTQRARGAHYPGRLPAPDRHSATPPAAAPPAAAATSAVGGGRAASAPPRGASSNGSAWLEPPPLDPTPAEPGLAAGRGNGSTARPAPPADEVRKPAASGVGDGEQMGETPLPRDVPDWAPEDDHSLDTSGERAAVAPLGSAASQTLPEAYTELLEFEQPTGLIWDETPPDPPGQASEPRPDQLEILSALFELRFLLTSQIHRRWMPDKSLRTAQRRLDQMFRAGWVRRFKITTRKQGKTQWTYSLGERGFKLAQAHTGRRGPFIDPQLKWQQPDVRDAAFVLHDLHAAASLFALETLAKPFARAWRGSRSSLVEPPMTRERSGQWRRKTADELAPNPGERIRDLRLEEFAPVRPDLALELNLVAASGARRRVDLFLEQDRTRRASANVGKLEKYDAFLTAWALALDRFKLLGEPPIVLFVCADGPKARQFADAADQAMTGRIARRGLPEFEWNHLGRKRVFFCAEPDLHAGSLRCLKLPEWPPELRSQLALRKDNRPPERAQLEFTQVGLLGGEQVVRKAAAVLAAS